MSNTVTSQWQEINKVVVVGLGVTGLSVVNYLRTLPHDLTIQVIDTREQPPGLDALDPSIDYHIGSWRQDWLNNADLIITNPGIAPSSPPLQLAAQQSIPIVGDIEIFAWAARAPIVAITGSNGKSTVTDLTGYLARSIGIKVAVGGNIGIPALDLLDDEVELYVLELSSFQLETTFHLSLQAAAYLNLSEDHMDRYNSMKEYGQAKQRIFEHAQCAIVNRDDQATYPIHTIPTVSFGLDDQEFGVTQVEGQEYLSKNGEPLIALTSLQLVGRHNAMNCLVALALLDSVNLDITKALPALKAYQGLTHRCQLVLEKQGVRWINDSKATNVASTLAALSGLQLDGTLHLLVGGVGKGADFSLLIPALKALKVQLHCFGKDGDAFLELHPSAQRWDNIEQILSHISPQLVSGDIVMLSPACASFDQFKNFMARGDEFTRLAQQYA